jgi:hypothetical protein
LLAAGKFETLPVTGTYYGAALLWKLDVGWNWPPQQVVDDMFEIVDAAAFSPDGTRLALSTHKTVPPWDVKVRVLDLNTQQETLALMIPVGLPPFRRMESGC